jgi:hypothetical protein
MVIKTNTLKKAVACSAFPIENNFNIFRKASEDAKYLANKFPNASEQRIAM